VTRLVFAKLYFPASDPLIGALQAFSSYAVGFVARPIGAAIFGHYGDRIGRKAALIATLLLTGIATFAVGFVWGAVVLTILRFIQAVGRHHPQPETPRGINRLSLGGGTGPTGGATN
jgi:MFS family permease